MHRLFYHCRSVNTTDVYVFKCTNVRMRVCVCFCFWKFTRFDFYFLIRTCANLNAIYLFWELVSCILTSREKKRLNKLVGKKLQQDAQVSTGKKSGFVTFYVFESHEKNRLCRHFARYINSLINNRVWNAFFFVLIVLFLLHLNWKFISLQIRYRICPCSSAMQSYYYRHFD